MEGPEDLDYLFEEAISYALLHDFVRRTLEGFGDYWFGEEEKNKDSLFFYFFETLLELRWSDPETIGAIIYSDSAAAKSILLELARCIEMGPDKHQIDPTTRVCERGVLGFIEKKPDRISPPI